MGWGGYGKGYGGGWGWNPWMMGGYGGKGKGKGLRDFSTAKKVWIGGLPPTEQTSVELNKKLKEHMSQAGECLRAEINKSGVGGAAFKTEEEVQKAVSMLNGSMFEGVPLQVDVWTKKEATPAAS